MWSQWRDRTLAEYVLGKLGERVEAEGEDSADSGRLERVRRVHAWARRRDPAS
ncbi:hypothetical protein [Nocardiopsis prasina]|uniref:hypothetical protein n=1 Tax=Nocardiopsis prasina TaxID=2015 RepID=UPI000344FB9A|nr:hypothetical protein [Nocardiopsis prasina]